VPTFKYIPQAEFHFHFLVAFTKLRKVIISFAMSVGMEQLASHWTDFHEILYPSIF
jgi:hypothetical protein